MIHIVLKGNPISTQHAYGMHGKIKYMTNDAKALKNAYILFARCGYKGRPLKTSLSTYIRLYFADKRRRDVDNWHKISLDSLTGIVYEDDSQIKLLTIEIMPPDKQNPRIEIFVEEITGNL